MKMAGSPFQMSDKMSKLKFNSQSKNCGLGGGQPMPQRSSLGIGNETLSPQNSHNSMESQENNDRESIAASSSFHNSSSNKSSNKSSQKSTQYNHNLSQQQQYQQAMQYQNQLALGSNAFYPNNQAAQYGGPVNRHLQQQFNQSNQSYQA